MVWIDPKADHSADVAAMTAAINGNTCLVVGSAPGYPFGIMDPIVGDCRGGALARAADARRRVLRWLRPPLAREDWARGEPFLLFLAAAARRLFCFVPACPWLPAHSVFLNSRPHCQCRTCSPSPASAGPRSLSCTMLGACSKSPFMLQRAHPHPPATLLSRFRRGTSA